MRSDKRNHDSCMRSDEPNHDGSTRSDARNHGGCMRNDEHNHDGSMRSDEHVHDGCMRSDERNHDGCMHETKGRAFGSCQDEAPYFPTVPSQLISSRLLGLSTQHLHQNVFQLLQGNYNKHGIFSFSN